jgi:hypothetical protein
MVTKDNVNTTPMDLKIASLKGNSVLSSSFIIDEFICSQLVLCIIYECMGSSLEKEMRTILDKVSTHFAVLLLMLRKY